MLRRYYDFTDQALIEMLCHDDDRAAFAEIYWRYGRQLVLEAIRKTGDRNAAEDIVQEVFVKLWLRRHKLVIQKNLQAYLKGMLRYHVIDHYLMRENSPLVTASLLSSFPDPADDDYLAGRLLHNHYLQALSRLPDKCRQVFELSRKGFSIRDISEQLHISEKTVEVHIGKALRLLRKEMRDYINLLFILLLID